MANEPVDAATEADELEARRIEQARGAVNRLKVLMDPVRRGDEAQVAELSMAFSEQMLELLQTGDVTLTIDDDGMWMGEGELTGKDLVGRAMLEGLVGEGLDAVTVLPTASPRELVDLARMLARDWREKRSDENDLEAEAWHRAFGHIYLEIASRRVVTEVDEGDVGPEEMVARLIRQLGVETIEQHSAGGAAALDAEIGAVMDQVRRIGDGSLEEPSLDELRATRTHQRFLRELDSVRADKDVDGARVGLVLFEAVRHAAEPAHAAGAIAEAGRHLRAAVRGGDLALAGAMARRLGTLVQPGLFRDWPHRAVVGEALGALLDAEMAAAVAAGLRRNPDREAWKGLLFSLGQLASPERLGAVVGLGRPLSDRDLKQALADAMLMVADRGETDLRRVLAEADDEDLAVVLLALGRRPDPTLVELILAREGSADAQVREAVLVALRTHQSPRIKVVMREALTDPASQVRMEALRYLTVYRDAAAADVVQQRLAQVTEQQAEEPELRALAIASAIMTRGTGLERLEQVATGGVTAKHPLAPRAALHGLKAGGAAGRTALERVGRSQPALRDEIRALLGGSR